MSTQQKVFATLIPLLAAVSAYMGAAHDSLVDLGLTDTWQDLISTAATVAIAAIGEIAVIWGVRLPTRAVGGGAAVLLAVGLAGAAFLASGSTSAYAAGCEDGNRPSYENIARGIYWCSDPQGPEVAYFEETGHIYNVEWRRYLAQLAHLEELGLDCSSAFFATGSSPETNFELVSTFCDAGLYVITQGPRECNEWSGRGVWPEADLEACAEWAAAAFSQYSVGVYTDEGVVCTPIDGCQRVHGAAFDNPAQDVILGVACPDGCPKAEPEVVVVEPLRPPAAGSGGLRDAGMGAAGVLVGSGLLGALGLAVGVGVAKRLRFV